MPETQFPEPPDQSDARQRLTDLHRFQSFVASVSDYAIYMLSPEGTVSSWNVGARRFKGYTAEEIIGRHFSVFYTDDDQRNGKPARALEIARREGKYEEEGWRQRKDGTRFWASVVIDRILDEQGALLGFAKITRDITERRAALEALRESEERFRLLVQRVTDYAIYTLSPTGEVTDWNLGAERIKGYTREEIVGSHFSRFFTEDDRIRGLPARALETAESTGRFESEGWRLRKDGSRFWANAVIDAIRNDDGELIGFAKITRDVTERKEAAEALERTKEALFQSQKLEAVGKLTGGIAHDFNNLLGVVISGLDLFAHKALSPTEQKVMESMQRAASQAATLTQQLLAFARRQPLRRDKYNINRVILSFEAVLSRVGPSSMQLELQLAPQLDRVLIDSTQFEAALLNLVSNARDAMPLGGKVTISTAPIHLQHGEIGSLPEGPYVMVTVADTGSGMSSDVVERAFEPFFTTKRLGQGTGLGLSQVYGLIRQSDGDLVIRSEPGRGTSVAMYLPAIMAVDDEHDDREPAGQVTETALLVDDQPDVLSIAVELFRYMGYEVLSANNGEEALDILRRRPDVDVLFTDMVMPGMTGLELSREAVQLVPDIKVVLTSGYPAPALKKEQSERLQFHFLHKPYRLPEIMRLLRTPG